MLVVLVALSGGVFYLSHWLPALAAAVFFGVLWIAFSIWAAASPGAKLAIGSFLLLCGGLTVVAVTNGDQLSSYLPVVVAAVFFVGFVYAVVAAFTGKLNKSQVTSKPVHSKDWNGPF